MRNKKTLETRFVVDSASRTMAVHLNGFLGGRHECYEFLDTLRAQLSPDVAHVSIDLSGLEKVNGNGIGILASIAVAASENGGRMCLVGGADKLVRYIKGVFPAGFLYGESDSGSVCATN